MYNYLMNDNKFVVAIDLYLMRKINVYDVVVTLTYCWFLQTARG